MSASAHPDQDAARAEHVRALASGAAVAELVALLDDPSWFVRREVVGALGRLGELAELPLIDCLQTRRDNEARVAATVDALVACNSSSLDARLIGLARDDVAAAVLADFCHILGRRRSRSANELLAHLTRHADDNVAVAAIEALGKLGGRAAVDALLACAETRQFFRTFPAIDVLGRSGDPRAVAPLIELLGDSRYTLEAARALGRSADRRAVEPLVGLLASPSEANVRVGSLALTELCERHGQLYGSKAVVEDAIRRARSEAIVRRLGQSIARADKAERIAICNVLGMLWLESALPALSALLDGEPEVAEAASKAVVELGRANAHVLVDALLQGNATRRRALLPAVSRLAAAAAVQTCLGDADPEVRILACAALARIGAVAGVPRLFALLSDANARVVNAAIAAIQSLGTSQTEALTLAAAREPRTRRAALRVLAYFGFPKALPLFAAAAREPDPRLRDVALQGLSLIEEPQARDVLLECAASDDPAMRAAAVRALGHRADDSVTARLLTALQDQDAWVRYYACQALGRHKTANAESELCALVHDSAGQVRVAAIEALSTLGTASAVQPLREAVHHEDPDLRRAALVGLGLAVDQPSLPVLMGAASQGDATTRLVALSALARFTDECVVALWLETARTGAEPLRVAAINLLAERPGLPAASALVQLLLQTEESNLLLNALSKNLAGRVAALEAELARADEDQARLLVACIARSAATDADAALYRAAMSSSVAVRRSATGALAGVNTPEARAVLESVAVDDPDAEMRRISQLYLESK